MLAWMWDKELQEELSEL